MIHWIGDTVIRIDKISAIRHNTKSDLGPTNRIIIILDDSQSSSIAIDYYNYEEASDDFEKLANKLEAFYKK